MTLLAARTGRITPFYVMEIVKEAARLQAAGRSIIHMSIGEPDFSAPPAVRQAAEAVLAQGQTAYTPALGLDELRQRIASHYLQAFGVSVTAERVVVTAGASAALLLPSTPGVPPFTGRLELRGVCFSYPSRPAAPVLRGLSLRVEPGDIAAPQSPQRRSPFRM